MLASCRPLCSRWSRRLPCASTPSSTHPTRHTPSHPLTTYRPAPHLCPSPRSPKRAPAHRAPASPPNFAWRALGSVRLASSLSTFRSDFSRPVVDDVKDGKNLSWKVPVSWASASKPQRVAVAMSGGVDSSVAAWLVAQQRGDLEVEGVYMYNWDDVDELGHCPGDADWRDVQRVAQVLGMRVRRVEFVREYWVRVFESFLAMYAAGLTPNPDVMCNREIKFGVLKEHLSRVHGTGMIATGHYARVDDGRLFAARDAFKDQSYFLSSVPREALQHVAFPLGEFTKAQVRELARHAGLPTAGKPDSQGLCFVGRRRKFAEFLGNYLVMPAGEIVHVESGKVLGEHKGLCHYTLGQGAAIGGCPERMYVCGKDMASNRLLVAPGHEHEAFYSDTVLVGPGQWASDQVEAELPQRAGDELRVLCRLRHQGELVQGTMARVEGQVEPLGEGVEPELRELLRPTFRVRFETAQRAVAPGQVLAVYRPSDAFPGALEVLGSSHMLRGEKFANEARRE